MTARSESVISSDWAYFPALTIQNAALPTNPVAQASGMISVQADCSLNHALVLMVLRAREDNATWEQIATAVVDRDVRFGA